MPAVYVASSTEQIKQASA